MINIQSTGTNIFQNTESIIVYGSDSCHYCIETKSYLEKNNKTFEYFDIDNNQLKQNEMIRKLKKNNIPLNNVSLPVIDFNGKILINSKDFKSFLKQLTAK